MTQKLSDQYLKVVEWSQEDKCYVGTAPGLILGGVHGKDETKVFKELCKAIDLAIQIYQKEGKPLPEATADKPYSGKITLRIPSDLHKALALKAAQAGESLNKLIVNKLQTAV